MRADHICAQTDTNGMRFRPSRRAGAGLAQETLRNLWNRACNPTKTSLNPALRRPMTRRGGRVVECGGLENRCRFAPTQGSNPCLSAIYAFIILIDPLSADFSFQLIGWRELTRGLDWADLVPLSGVKNGALPQPNPEVKPFGREWHRDGSEGGIVTRHEVLRCAPDHHTCGAGTQ